jgi:hypothetical protein
MDALSFFIKFIAFIIVVAYIISPISISSGPLDEIIIFVVDMCANILFSFDSKENK